MSAVHPLRAFGKSAAGRPSRSPGSGSSEGPIRVVFARRLRHLRPFLTYRHVPLPTMSEAPQPVDRTAALLDRLIDLDMSAAEHVHAQLLAATEPAEVASLSRAYNRCSRGARQSVMLRMRWEKARAEAEARAARPAPKKYEPSPYDRMADIRIADLQDAVGRVAAVAHPDNPRRQREALDRRDHEIDIWNDDEDDILIVERLDDL